MKRIQQLEIATTGSRTQNDYELVKTGMSKIEARAARKATLIIHGGANGNDKLTERWANENGIRTTIIRPNYTRYARRYAPLIRNKAIVKDCDYLLAIYGPGARSNGTTDTIKKALKAGKKVLEYYNGEWAWLGQQRLF